MPHLVANGLRLGFDLSGCGERAVLLLHPFCLDREAFAPMVGRLAERSRVIRLDLRGHGASAAPAAPYDMNELAADVVAAMDALTLDHVDLVGLALGGCVAMHVAALVPDRIGRLVLAAAHAVTPAETGAVWDQRIATARAEGMASLAQMTLERWFGTALDDMPAELIADLRRRIGAMAIEGYAGAGMALKHHDGRRALGQIGAPTLVIAGDSDLAAPVERSREIVALLSDAQLTVLADCGHIASLHQADAFGAAVAEFLAA